MCSLTNVSVRVLCPQVSQCEKVAAPQEAPDRVGAEARLEGLLGVPKGHHAALLPVRLARGTLGGGGAQAPHHRRRRHHAAHPRAPQARPHFLPLDRLRGRLSLPGEMSLFARRVLRTSRPRNFCHPRPLPIVCRFGNAASLQNAPKSLLFMVKIKADIFSNSGRGQEGNLHIFFMRPPKLGHFIQKPCIMTN
jgi:hypothetical protein